MSNDGNKEPKDVRLIGYALGRTLTDDECKAVGGGGWTRSDRTGTLDWGDFEP